MNSSQGPKPHAIAPPPAPADIGVVAALGIEIQPFLAKLTKVRKYSSERHTIHEGELGNKLIALIICGPGRKAAERGTRLLLGGHRPHWVVSAGFGGALRPGLRRDDLVLPDAVIDPDGRRLKIDVALDDAADSRLTTGTLVTADAILRTAEEKAALRERTGADVVDMETSAVASLCAERRIRFLSLRVISDEAEVDLPPEIAAILGRSGGYRVGAALGAIWKRPSSVKDLWSLREHALSAANRLAEALPSFLLKLP